MPRDSRIITIENTKFIFITNFSGDPERDTYGNKTRKANIIIPTEEQADDLAHAGFNVKVCYSKEDKGRLELPKTTSDYDVYLNIKSDLEMPVTFYVSIIANFDSEWPPSIYTVCDGKPEKLTEKNVSRIDKVYVTNVNAVLNPYYSKRNDSWSLYIKTMYVEYDDTEDPFAQRYAQDE